MTTCGWHQEMVAKKRMLLRDKHVPDNPLLISVDDIMNLKTAIADIQRGRIEVSS